MKNIPFRVRMLIAFLAIFLLPLLLIGIPGGVFITRSAQQDAMAEADRLCAEAAQKLQSRLDRMDSYMMQVQNDTLVQGVMHMRDTSTMYRRYTAIDFARYANQLRLMLFTTDAFDDLALCFPQQDFALTQRGVYSLEQLFRNEFYAEGMEIDDWLAAIGALGTEHRFLPLDTIYTFGPRRPGLLYACPLPMQYGEGTRFAVLFFLSEASLDSALEPTMRYPGMTLALCDGDGMVLYRLAGGALETEGDYAWESQVGQSGLTLRITVPRSEIMRTPTAVRNAVLAILALMGALGGALSALVAYVNYRPLEGIFSILFERGTLPEQHPSANSLKNIGPTLATLLEKDDYLQRQLDEYHDLLQYAALSRLLDGSLSAAADAPEGMFDALGMPMPYRFFSVGICYRQQEDAAARIEQCSQAMQLRAYSLEQDGRLVFLLNHAAEDAMRQLTAEDAQPPLLIGVSLPCTRLADAHGAYRQALYAVNYRPVRTDGGAVFYADVYDAQSNYFYPVEAEHRLVNLLHAGDAEGARVAFDKLLGHNLQDEPAAYVLHCFLDNVATTVFRQGDIDRVQWEREHPPLDAQAPLDSMVAWTYALLDAAAQQARQDTAAQPDPLLQQAVAYIEAHLCDSQLSLGAVAAHCGVSTAHLSRHIKKTAGIGYLDLVNRDRIQQAKLLLRRGDMSIKNIAITVGFDSDVTLRRQFKKYEGVAPTQYGQGTAREG